MAEIFDSLALCDDRAQPRSAAASMAADEALLATASQPILRVYSWQQPTVSFGYFIPVAHARLAAPAGSALMRRWTGGGIVPHGPDFTWSLIIPRNCPAARLPPAESYQQFHRTLASALAMAGFPSEQCPAVTPVPAGGLCFEAPAPGDLMQAGRKLAGAGQRRCRHGLLHQGSVAPLPLPPDFPHLLARSLSAAVTPFSPVDFPADLCDSLTERYASPSWLGLR
ncbi:MAG: hypothetical protein RLZZ179_1229 [Verrucomicrobiota bacterium]|jgi:lipoate-protein ligase A